MADESSQKQDEEENPNKSELTAKQRKNKKKKEAAKKKKQEQREKNGVTDSQREETVSPQEKLEEELVWCISQLEIGLKSQKPDKTTASKTENLIKNLKSPKVPLPKKRQIMRSLFGDYRKKMQEDMKKAQSKDAEQERCLKVFPVKKDQQRSVFIRVAHDEKQACEDTLNKVQQNGLEQAADSSSGWKFEPSSGDFKFNFDTAQLT